MKYGIELGYVSKLGLDETCDVIDLFYDNIFSYIKNEWNVKYIHSPVVTENTMWLNDDFNSSIRPIDFDAPDLRIFGESLLSNNKWRRKMIAEKQIEKTDEGIFSTFSTIRRDVKVNNLTSLTYSEIGIELFSDNEDQENIFKNLTKLYSILYSVDSVISKPNKKLSDNHLPQEIVVISYNKLKKLYPLDTFAEKINLFGIEVGAFILYDYIVPLINGKSDFKSFSEDVFNFKTYSSLYVYNCQAEKSIEVAYGSYQVTKEVLKEQHNILKENAKSETTYNHLIKSSMLPLTISLGIDINRFLMIICEKQHIAEVHSSIWNPKFIEFCKRNNVEIF